MSQFQPRKLHLGCGPIKLEGYLNIDFKAPADETHDLTKKLPFEDGSISEIASFHFFEHLPFKTALKALADYHRLLIPGGLLVLEMPDFDGCVEWYRQTRSEVALQWIFGNQETKGQFHQWGWSKDRLQKALEEAGFDWIIFSEPKDYHVSEGPCLRVQASKSTS